MPIRFAGLDTARTRDFSAIVIGGVVNRVMTIEVAYQYPRAASPETPYYSMLVDGTKAGHIRGIKSWYAEYKWLNMGVDKSQNGEAVCEALRARGVPNTPVNFSIDWKNDAINLFLWCVGQKQIRIPKEHDELIQQILEQQRIIGKSASGKPQFAHPTGRHDDEFWACLLALWSAKQYLIAGKAILATGKMGSQRDDNQRLRNLYGV